MTLTDFLWTCPHCGNRNATPLSHIHDVTQLWECETCHTVYLGALSWLMETYYDREAGE
jgi:rubredoxin